MYFAFFVISTRIFLLDLVKALSIRLFSFLFIVSVPFDLQSRRFCKEKDGIAKQLPSFPCFRQFWFSCLLFFVLLLSAFINLNDRFSNRSLILHDFNKNSNWVFVNGHKRNLFRNYIS